MASKDTSAGDDVVPDVDPKTNTASSSTYDIPRSVKNNDYDILPVKRENKATTTSDECSKTTVVKNVADSVFSTDTEDAKPRAKGFLLKQEPIHSSDDPGDVDMKVDGCLTPYKTVHFNVHDYETINEDKLDRSCFESNSTNTQTGKPVPPPRPESTLRPVEEPYRQTLPPPLPTSHPPSSSPKVPRPVRFFDDTDYPKEFSNPLSSESCRIVLIRGIPADMSTEDIADNVETELAMKNAIEELRVNRTYKEVVVTFRNSKVAEEILERALSGEKFFMSDREVIVLPYQQPHLDQMKALVSGLARGTTAEDISRCIEKRCGNRPSRVILGENPGIAIICLQNSDDLMRLRADSCFLRQSNGKTWFISVVERTRKVMVKVVAMETEPEALKHYFENTELSHGGVTESIIYRNSSQDYIVTFANYEDAENVVERANHTINDVSLEVSVYHPCLDVSEEYLARRPPPKQLHNLDRYISRFLQHSQRYRADLEDIVRSHHGRVIWPPEKSKDCLQIECDIDVRDRSANDKIKDWVENSAVAVSQVCKMLTVYYQYCSLEILNELKTNIKKMEVPYAEKTYISSEENFVVIAGESKHVDDMVEKIKQMVSPMEEILDSQGKPITKMLKLKRHEMELLQSTACLEKLKFVNAKLENQKIIFKTVDDALFKVKENLKTMPQLQIEGINALSRKLLQTNNARKYVEEKIREEKITGVLEVLQDDTLVLYSKTKEEVKEAESILKSSLKTTPIKVEPVIQKLMRRKEGKQFLDKLEHKYEGKLRTHFHQDELNIVSLDTFHQEIKENVMKYIDSHSECTEFMRLDPGTFRYIFMYKSQDIDAMEQQYKRRSVEIDIIDKKTRTGFIISGQKDICKLAIVDLHAIIETVVRSDHFPEWPMFERFLQSQEGIDEIDKIELSEKCVLTVSTCNTLPLIQKKRSSTLASCRIGMCEIKIVEGDITELEIEFIVNPTEPALKHKRGFGRTLVDKGGFIIQKECQDYIQRGRSLKDGDVVVSAAGSLRCKGIIHVVLPQWKGGCCQEEVIFHDAVMKCLREAEKQKSSSIAFPPVGLGQFLFPQEIVAKVLIKTLKEYLTEIGTDTYLRQVYVCDLEGEMSPRFVDELEMGFGHINILIPDKRKIDQTDSSQLNTNGESFIRIKKDIIIGSLASQDTDVIVNSTNTVLDLRVGTLSRILLKQGGDQILTECKDKYPNGITIGQVAETTGGDLKCKAIFHGVLTQWEQGSSYSETILGSFVRNCLNAAHKKQYASIAFPVLGTGALGFPADIVADLMFDTIDTFEKNVPNSSLKTVCIVICPDDKTSIKEFEEHVSRCSRTRIRSKAARVSHRQSCRLSSVFVESGTSYTYTTTIDHVTLRIEHGDLTNCTTAVIVNSVLEDLNLNTGIISKAILNAGGMSIQREAKENFKTFKEEGLVMTNSGQLLCQKIIHVKAKNSINGWKRVVGKCLEQVEKSGLNSVSFPALGTGGKGFSCEQIAKSMVEAVQEYVLGDSYIGPLNTVAIVVYEKDMVEKFTKEAKSVFAPSSRKSFFQEVKKKFDRKHPDETPAHGMVIHIYSESPKSDEKILERLQSLRQIIKLPVAEEIMANMSELQVSNLKQIGQRNGIEVCVSKDRFILSGYGKEVLQIVEGKVQVAINSVKNCRATCGTRH